MNITLSTDDKRIHLTQEEQSIRLAQENNKVNLSQNTTDISLTQFISGIDLATDDNRITFTQPNLRGLPGPEGPEGPAGPEGPVGNDKNYTITFSPTDNLVVTHNLDKYPAVGVISSAGDEVVGNVNHLTTNSLIVSFSAPFGGRITCN